MEYDTDNVKKCDEGLNTALIFVRSLSCTLLASLTCPSGRDCSLLSAQRSSLTSTRSSNPIRTNNPPAILPTLNQSAIPGETPIVPPPRADPPSDIVTVTGLLYASLLISLLAAFVAMLGKQWVNQYLRHSGSSAIERCGDRQRKCNGLTKWPLHLFVEIIPVMLQIALLLFCALCKYMTTTKNSVARVLLALTILGVAFYLGIIIAGTSSYDSPFQTPGSIALRGSWITIGPFLTPVTLSIVAVLRSLREIIWHCIIHIITRSPHHATRPLFMNGYG